MQVSNIRFSHTLLLSQAEPPMNDVPNAVKHSNPPTYGVVVGVVVVAVVVSDVVAVLVAVLVGDVIGVDVAVVVGDVVGVVIVHSLKTPLLYAAYMAFRD